MEAPALQPPYPPLNTEAEAQLPSPRIGGTNVAPGCHDLHT